MQRKEGLVTTIAVKDESGRVVAEIEAITFKGLLSLAHDEGLCFVRTRLLQRPTEDNDKTAIAFTVVRTRRGTFTGLGDANPSNVNRRIVPHIIRMAETRATARALRVAVNIGEVAIEELAEDMAPMPGASVPPAERPSVTRDAEPSTNDRPERFRGRDDRPTEAREGDRRAMSEEQRKLLFRLALQLGESRDTAPERVLRALGVERFEQATRVDASRAIDVLKREALSKERPTNGGASHAH